MESSLLRQGRSLNSEEIRAEIIVPIHNQLHVTKPCLESVLRWTNSQRDRVTLIADACDGKTSSYLENWVGRFGNARIFHSQINLGFVRSCNLGLKNAVGKVCVLLNSDTCVTPGWTDKFVSCLNSDQKIGVASPLSNFAPNMRIPILPGYDYLEMNALLEGTWNGDYPDVTTPEGFCFCISRSCLAEIGYLDEAFDDGYGEESDLAMRASYHGFRTVFLPNTYIYHQGRASFGGERREALYRRSRRVFNARWKNSFPLAVEEFRRRDPVSAISERAKSGLQPGIRSAFRSGIASTEAEKIDNSGRRIQPSVRKVSRLILHRSSGSLRILCILPTLNPYGGVISVATHLNYLIDLGHKVRILSLSEVKEDFLFLKTEPILLTETLDLVALGEQDIVLATSWETVFPVCRLVELLGGAPKPIYYVQDIESDFFSEAESEKRDRALTTYKMIPTRVVKTQHLVDRLGSMGIGAHRISPGMNLDLFYPRPVAPTKPGQRIVLGMARPGAPNDIRGFEVLSKVFNILRSERADVALEVFGARELPSTFECHRNYGRLRRDQLPEVYSRSDIFVETSLMHGFGRTCVEAMACGTACVISDSGGIREYAVDRENSLIVPTGDAEATAFAIMELLDNEELRLNLALRGQARVQSFDHEVATNELLNVFRQALVR